MSTDGSAIRSIDAAAENMTRAGFRVIVKVTIDNSKAQKVSERTFYPAVIEAKGDHGYEASSDEPICAVTSQAARCVAQR